MLVWGSFSLTSGENEAVFRAGASIGNCASSEGSCSLGRVLIWGGRGAMSRVPVRCVRQARISSVPKFMLLKYCGALCSNRVEDKD